MLFVPVADLALLVRNSRARPPDGIGFTTTDTVAQAVVSVRKRSLF
jgi:hypothetical protein